MGSSWSLAAAPEPSAAARVRRLGPGTAEIKRMWVRPGSARLGVGAACCWRWSAAPSNWDATAVRLDTAASLTEALALYKSAGYAEIPAYNDNFLRRALARRSALAEPLRTARQVERVRLFCVCKHALHPCHPQQRSCASGG